MRNVYPNEILGYTSTEYESFEDLFSAVDELKIKMQQNFSKSSMQVLVFFYRRLIIFARVICLKATALQPEIFRKIFID